MGERFDTSKDSADSLRLNRAMGRLTEEEFWRRWKLLMRRERYRAGRSSSGGTPA